MLKSRDISAKTALTIVLIAMLVGCKATDKFFSKEEKQSGTANQAQVVVQAQPGLSPRERFSKALEHLEQGEAPQAKAELQAYLINIPASSSAKELLKQIDSPASSYFPPEFFEVTLSSGESLSTLAGKYLNSPLKFYALAKYNDIASPSRVNIGQTIRIPLTAEAKFVRSQPAKTPEKQKPVDVKAKEIEVATETQADNVEDPIEDAVTSELVKAETAKPMPPSQDSLLERMTTLTQQQDFAAAVEQYQSLKAFGDLSRDARSIALIALEGYGQQLAATDKKDQASINFAEAAGLSLLNGNKMQAFRDFKQATELHPQNSQAMEEMLILQKEISDQYHREASSAFRRQELDTAIDKWEKVLEVDPNHNSAKLYLAQALELKERLEKIKN
ncbi:LysM peptidoglycan-binding domain-containing protein [Bowmanella denitrificans]|uniref:LysM peptidoglycan-binding domain-containing protein n=1 Tax=Bowmanella denitrificans TaxID=366582 RepID=UPI000C9AD53D|nr:LysM peptidoglycan-binding domain-containing protein [Bowmanella denitrificans]